MGDTEIGLSADHSSDPGDPTEYWQNLKGKRKYQTKENSNDFLNSLPGGLAAVDLAAC
jgi:hypothetical protein